MYIDECRGGCHLVAASLQNVKKLPFCSSAQTTHVLHRYASEQLTWLAVKASSVAPASYLNQLQQQITDCDKRGNTNASVPPEETTADLARHQPQLIQSGFLTVLELL